MQIDRDVPVPTRDGTPIVVDVFRPDGDGPVPVIACISPYGKGVHWPERYPQYEHVPHHEHMVWETPDPVWWTDRGYAVLRADTRGTGASPGRLDLYGPQDAEDFHDVIEWAGTQPWSTGKVASSGISWLAMMGWRAAALRPPHLAALVAWEGSTDFYREAAYQGGLYNRGFLDFWWARQIDPQRTGPEGDDWREVLPQHRLLDDYHRARATALEDITVPLLSGANWGGVQLHLRGNVEGWRRAASEHKWLVAFTGTHIDPYYADWALDLQLRFLDRFLKGETHRMDDVAPVRLAIRHGREIAWRDTTDLPLPGTDWRELYLGEGTLAFEVPPTATTMPYPSTFDTAPVSGPLEITGPVALRLWLTAAQDDLDVFVRLHHLDADGTPIPAVGPQGQDVPMAMGWLKASHRETDPARSEPYRPWHPHDREVPLSPGEPTLLEVEIWPTSITLAPGERLRLEFATEDSELGTMAHDHPDLCRPARDAVVHVGGEHASHLLVPVIPDDRA